MLIFGISKGQIKSQKGAILKLYLAYIWAAKVLEVDVESLLRSPTWTLTLAVALVTPPTPTFPTIGTGIFGPLNWKIQIGIYIISFGFDY